MKITLLIPTLNEIDGVKVIMPRIQKDWCDQIIILDGNSTDGTVEWLRDHGYFVYLQKKPGVRQGFMEVWPLIEGDVVITFSPDGNSIPELLPDLIKKAQEGYDMVIVSRYLNGARSLDDTWLTRFGNWFFTGIINVLHGSHYTDGLVIYRAYKKNLVYDLELDKDEGYVRAEKLFQCRLCWEILLSVRIAKRGLRAAEIPGDEPPRIGGTEKRLIWRWGAAFLYQIIREVFCWR
jgi:glycosyltransferase involved in cell wall biosynthesis